MWRITATCVFRRWSLSVCLRSKGAMPAGFPLSDFVHEISKKTISAIKTYFISYFLFQTNAVDARPKLRFLTFVKLL